MGGREGWMEEHKQSKQECRMEGGGGCHGDSEKPERSRKIQPVSPSYCLFSS